MQSLFRRKSADAVVDADPAAGPGAGGENGTAAPGSGTSGSGTSGSVASQRAHPRSYTPSKKELGKATPKRRAGGRAAEPPPANRREALRRTRQKRREARAEARAGMMAGKEEYLLPRDKGPERGLARDIVDARRNLATYFLPGALIVIIGSAAAMPAPIRLGANMFWFALAFGVIVDSVLLCRRVRQLVAQRLPKSTVRPRSLYLYAIMRSLSFRRMRMPAPQRKLGEKI